VAAWLNDVAPLTAGKEELKKGDEPGEEGNSAEKAAEQNQAEGKGKKTRDWGPPYSARSLSYLNAGGWREISLIGGLRRGRRGRKKMAVTSVQGGFEKEK